MTPKEAFRDLSHKFHGKGPGKMKLEKRQKKYQDDLKTKQMKSSDTPLMSAEKMREAQARGQTPYLVLSGNAKSGYVVNTYNLHSAYLLVVLMLLCILSAFFFVGAFFCCFDILKCLHRKCSEVSLDL
jgi:hypothetical protein